MISVCIPAHNSWETIEETLHSVYDNTIVPTQVLIVDDVSSNKERYDKILSKFPATELHFNKKNVGSFSTFNECMSLARHPYIHVLHSDDMVSKNFYETLTYDMKEKKRQAFFYSTVEVNAEGKYLRKLSLQAYNRNELFKSLLCDNIVRTPSVVVTRDVITNVGHYRTDLPHVADWDLWLRILDQCEGDIYISDKAHGIYRSFEHNKTTKMQRSGKALSGKIKLLTEMRKRYKDYKSEIDQSKRNLCKESSIQILKFLAKSEFKPAFNNLRELKNIIYV